jgi:hypothetical protein
VVSDESAGPADDRSPLHVFDPFVRPDLAAAMIIPPPVSRSGGDPGRMVSSDAAVSVVPDADARGYGQGY